MENLVKQKNWLNRKIGKTEIWLNGKIGQMENQVN